MTQDRKPVASSSEHGNEPSDSDEVVNFFPCRLIIVFVRKTVLKLVTFGR